MTSDFVKVAGPYNGESNGPIWDGEAILFSLPAEHRILRYHPGTGSVVEHRNYTVGARGLALGTDRQIYACQSAGRRVARLNVDGSASMLADRFEDGQLHNNPYDLVFDSVGRIWFTDPEPPMRTFEPLMGYAAVLRLERNAKGKWALRRMTHDTNFPTGILLSIDEKTLYVADSPRGKDGSPELRVYPILPDGLLGVPRVPSSFAAGTELAGIGSAPGGNILLCVGGDGGAGNGALLVIQPSDGRVVERYSFSDVRPTNCVIVEHVGMRVLYVTSSDGSLFRTNV